MVILSSLRLSATAAFLTVYATLLPVTAAGGDFSAILPGETPDHTYVIPSYCIDSVKAALRMSGMHRIEGIWHVTDGATIAIERVAPPHPGANTLYRLTIIDSPDRSQRPGTVIGYASPTSDPVKYEARLFTATHTSRIASGRIPRPMQSTGYTMVLTHDDSRLSFTRHKRAGLHIDFRRSLPLLFRTTLRYSPATPQQSTAPEGCVRVFPAPAIPEHPIYL